MKLPDDPTPEQAERITPLLTRRMIEEVYTSGVKDFTIDLSKDSIVEGIFVGSNRDQGKYPEFAYKIFNSKRGLEIEYDPVAGVGEEDPEDDDDAEYSEYFDYSEYLNGLDEELSAELQEVMDAEN